MKNMIYIIIFCDRKKNICHGFFSSFGYFSTRDCHSAFCISNNEDKKQKKNNLLLRILQFQNKEEEEEEKPNVKRKNGAFKE